MSDLSDAELVARARAGDRSAFTDLFERHERLALRAVRAVTPDDEARRELAQVTMVEAYLSLDRLREPARFGAWLSGIALNVTRGWLRRQRAQPLSLDDLAGGTTEQALAERELDPARLFERREQGRQLRAAIAALGAEGPRRLAAVSLRAVEPEGSRGGAGGQRRIGQGPTLPGTESAAGAVGDGRVGTVADAAITKEEADACGDDRGCAPEGGDRQLCCRAPGRTEPTRAADLDRPHGSDGDSHRACQTFRWPGR